MMNENMIVTNENALPIELLRKSRVIAVLGCSDKPERDSYMIAEYLISRNFTVYPVNPFVRFVLGRKCYPSLADVPERIDMVDVFRRPEFALGIVEESARIGAGTVWFQPGTVSDEALARAAELGIAVVSDACTRVVYPQVQ